MHIQPTDWGKIEWLHLKEKNNANQSMNIGRTVISPHSHQVRHVHYGQEQMLYILSGEGIYRINGQEQRYGKGAIIYMEAGSTHETINDTDFPICELLVSNPVGTQPPSSQMMKWTMQSEDNLLYAAVESLRGQFIDPLNLPLTIFDVNWKIVYQSPHLPDFCRRHCNPEEKPEQCACMKACRHDGTLREFICPMGLRLYSMPVIFQKEIIGTVRGGFILLSGSTRQKHAGLYDMPESAALSIRRMIEELASSLVNYCDFNHTRRELLDKEEAIRNSQKQGELLKQDLQTARDTVTNLKINHHFLFNTLNSMASMALQDGSERLYNSIIDLSDLFRYTMRTNRRFIAFERELEYLNHYLNLQKLRYREDLCISYDLDDNLEGIAVPFNFLQPIAENAFVHGFDRDARCRKIWIVAKIEKGQVVISITNNGTPLHPITLNRVNRSLASGSHGLSMIYTKLRDAFNEKFSINLISTVQGTTVRVIFPAQQIEEE